MNILLAIGLLLIVGYVVGLLAGKIGIPRTIGYIATGMLFSPNTINFIDREILLETQPLMDVCLAFIAFEVGGALKWSRIKKHEKEIISITLLASIIPYLFIAAGILAFDFFLPGIFPFNFSNLLAFALLLGALASPTEPAATLAVMHQYKAKGKVSDTIMGIAALDDVLGILLFSVTLGVATILTGGQEVLFENAILSSFYKIVLAIIIGTVAAIAINISAKLLRVTSEGHWIIILFAIIILCLGASKLLLIDELLAGMTMGVVVVNYCPEHKAIFRILERYTEEFIFLFFFLLSGLHLNISTIPHAVITITLFVLLRIMGKYTGAITGAGLVRANRLIQRYTGGGLLPQGGIVIGLVLSIYHREEFKGISEILLTTVMGASIINELIGPVTAKHSLMKSGEIKNTEHNKK